MSKFSIEQEIKLLPIHEYAFLKPEEVIFSEEVREICEGNSCGMYGTSWACPPAVGSLEECQKQCLEYEDTFIFTTATQIKNSYDVQGWLEARRQHEKLTDKVGEVFRKYAIWDITMVPIRLHILVWYFLIEFGLSVRNWK